jgi:predicted glycosyltransferase
MGKVYGTLHRALQLYAYIRDQKIDFALSHGSRAQVIASRLLGISSYAFFDYDHSDTKLFHILCANVFVPEVTINSFRNIKRVRKDFFIPYPGIKEEVYLEDWPLDSSILTSLGLDDSQIIAVLRTPASLAHYQNSKSDELFDLALNRLLQHPELCLIILPRYEFQRIDLFKKYGSNRRVVIPKHAIDAISLMASADIVVSGGGTMNRESAVLGTPTYSVFAGPAGTIDSLLENEERLVIIRRPNDVGKIEVRKKVYSNHSNRQTFPKKRLYAFIVQQVIDLYRKDSIKAERTKQT